MNALILPTSPTRNRPGATEAPRPPSFARLRPDRQPPDPRQPFAHQRDAWDLLSVHLEEARRTGVFQGMLVMPTGAGKTYTATTWLMKHVVDRGGRVVWLAHLDELLEQAAAAFHNSCGLARRRDEVAVRIVSARHHAAGQVDDADDVVVASVASLARKPDVIGTILDDPRTFLVVDEAHHGPARTYRAILDPLRARPRRNLLGLSATPTRTIPRERPVLHELFGNRVLYEARAAELIERGILARPILVRGKTHVAVDRGLTPSDLATLGRDGDFGQPFLDRIARLERRNQAVLDHYLTHRARYGKTLIFAITVEQAIQLVDRLRAAGVAAEYVAGARRDERDNREILRRFRDPAGGLDVVVNVNLLGEGVDLPAVRTVLLARPTASATRFMQMVGRALRGPAVGGTEAANVVAFRDDWEKLPDWLDLADEVPELAAVSTSSTTAAGVHPPSPTPASKSVEAVASRVRALVPDDPTDSADSVAERWYVLEGPDGARLVAVYSHQRAGWEAAIAHLEQLPAGALDEMDVAGLTATCFASGAAPHPSARTIGQLLEHFRGGGGRPVAYGPADRLAGAPATLARRIRAEDLGEDARCALLAEHYTPLARAIYPTRLLYHLAVEEALHALRYPEEAAWATPAAPVFEP